MLTYPISFLKSSDSLNPAAFVTEWTIPQDEGEQSELDRTITLYSFDASPSGYTMDYRVDFGDGTIIENVTTADQEHIYPANGDENVTYTVTITNQFGSLNMQRASATEQGYLTKMVQWGTDNVWSSLYRMFYFCSNMLYEATDFPNLTNLIEKKDAREMFRDCSSITSLDISNWTNTSNFTILQSSFQGLDACTSLNASGLDFSGVTTFNNGLRAVGSGVGGGCAIDLSDITWGALTSLSYTFYNTDVLTLDLSGWDFTGNPDVDLYYAFYNTDFNAALDLSSWENFSTWRCIYAFRGSDITSVNITGWDSSSVASYYGMFYQCYDIEQVIGLNGLSSAVVTGNGIQTMFQSTRKMNFGSGETTISSTAWGLGLGTCTSLQNTFYESGKNLVSGGDPPNVGNWVLGANTSLQTIFQSSKFSSPPDIESWDTSALTGVQTSLMYLADWGEPYTLDLTAWNFTSAVTGWSSSFRQVVNLTSIEFGDPTICDFGGVTNMSNMFYNSDQLVTITFNGATNFDAVTTVNNFAYDSDALETVDLGTDQDFGAVTNWNQFIGYNAYAPIDMNWKNDANITSVALSALMPSSQIETLDYDKLLIALDAIGGEEGNLQGGNSTYTLGGAAEAAHENLTNEEGKNWVISDGGGV